MTDDADSPALAATEARQRWMGVLARASLTDIEERLATVGDRPGYAWLRPPEIGTVMVRGRAGGSGSPFNMGEMTVTRCALRTDTGAEGHAYIAGRDPEKAALAALVDAMMQAPDQGAALEESVIAPLEQRYAERRDAASRKANATRVDFFTMVRGEDPRR